MKRENLKKEIAIVGAGFCGLAVAWYLSSCGFEKVTIFDEKGIGGGASGMAAGLMHPYVGAHNKKNKFGDEGYSATCELIRVAEGALQQSVANFSGLLRLATDQQQLENFTAAAKKYSDVMWRSVQENISSIPELNPYPGIFLNRAAIIDTKKYLQGLWIACQGKNVSLELKKIDTLHELNEFDVIIIAAGGGCRHIQGVEDVPIHLIKGQVLHCTLPHEHVLPYALNSYAYMLHSTEGCIAGATYEHKYIDGSVNEEFAIKEILPKIQAYYPQMNVKNVLGCKAGFRVSTPDRLPLIKRISEKCWIFTGMGSKGLLYHALYGKKLADLILDGVSAFQA